ncbi:MAG: Ig-like domain-containing protein [Ilumatobacteraceae bacterium]
MRNQPSRRRSVQGLRLALVASLLAIITPVVGSSPVATAATPTPWVASGPPAGNFTLDSDGSLTPPQMTYNLGEDPGGLRFANQAWTLSTTAASNFTDNVPYLYGGYHGFYAVRVRIDAFVTHLGSTITTTLAGGGLPVNCCIPPSGGFSYSGSHSFNVVDGDTYGFTVSGFNFDSDPHFFGTLTLASVPFTNPAVVASNTSWTTAAPLTAAGIDGTLAQTGEARWYKFPIQPDSQVQVDLTNLDQNFDLTLFRDIGQAFTTLTTTQDLTKLSAQFAADAYSPSVYSPSVYSPSVYSPSVYSPSVYSPSVYSPSVYSPSVYSPSVYSPSVYSPSVYSPSVYSPSVYSPSVYSPSDAFSKAFSSAQTRSLIGVSARENAEAESVRVATWNNTGDFYVRVQGRNGAFSPTPFHLALSTAGGPCAASPLSSFSGLPLTIAGSPGAAQTVILTDSLRLAPTPAVRPKLDELALRTGGVVKDLSESPRISALNLQADFNKACPYAKNLVAEAIREVVNSYRDPDGTLKYVVIAGGDDVIPFFRYADSAGIGPESDYIPPAVDASPSQASLRRNYVLGQDAYGAASDLSLKGAVLPVPDVAVGRLVEEPAEIIGMIDAYLGLANGALPTATSSLVTGYDFLTSAADSVQDDFRAGLGTNGRADSLITNQGVPTTTTTVGLPSRDKTWTAADLSTALLGSRHDLVFLAGHFSAFHTLAADYQTSLSTADLDAHPNLLANALVISAGCHAGFNLVDSDGVPGLSDGLDWPEAMARQRATFISGTGYQYADTDFLAYSAKLYALLATELRNGTGAVPLGQALVNAKQAYLAGVASLNGIDQKALIESTLYGLPMTGVDLPAGRIAPPVNGAGITPNLVPAGPGNVLGLKSATFNLTPSLTTPPPKPVLNVAGIPTGGFFRWLSGRDGVQSGPGLPALPKQIDDVTSSTGEVLRGVGFFGGTYTDNPGVIPLTGAPTTEQNGVHTDFLSPVFFPQKLATVNYFGALDGQGTDGRTRLITTPLQYRSDVSSSTTNTERSFSQLGLQLFYSSNTQQYGQNTPALAAPPSISAVTDTVIPASVTVQAHITGDPSAGIQKAWVTYTAESGPLHGSWQSVDLVQDGSDSTLWTATISLPSGQAAANMRYIVQAVNGVGLVGLDNNLGDGYTPGKVVGAPIPLNRTATSILLDATPADGISGTSLDVAATLTGAPAASAVTFTLGNVSTTVNVNESDRAIATLPLDDAVGDYTVSATYAGDDTHKNSSNGRAFSILKIPTTVTVTAGASRTINAMLNRTVPNGPLPEQTVYFDVTGPISQRFTATTDPNGQAKVLTGALPDGTYTVSAEFLGTPSTFAPNSSGPGVAVTLDATAPILTNVKLTPASVVVGSTTTLTALATDPRGISRVEYFVDTDPGSGQGIPLTNTAGSFSAPFGSNLTVGTHMVGVRALDGAGNWSAISTTMLTVTQIGLSVSSNVNRTGAVDLAGATISGNVAIFATPASSTSRVVAMRFHLDDANRASAPFWIQLLSPYDLNGTLKNGTAKLFDTRQLLNGPHTLTVELIRLNGTVERRTTSFTVDNPAPAVAQRIKVSTSATRSNPVDLDGRSLAGSVAIFVTPTTSVKSIAYWLDTTNLTVAPRSVDSAAQFDFNGTANNGQAILFNVTSLAPGTHRVAARVTYTNGTTAYLSSTFTR